MVLPNRRIRPVDHRALPRGRNVAPRLDGSRSEMDDGKRRHLWHRYRLTQDEYEGMIWIQDNRCAMCEASMDVPHIDHDHRCCPGRSSCGRCIRGLLCKPCNAGLGSYEKVAHMAPAYLAMYDLGGF